MTQKTAISPTRSENYPEWYQAVIKAADLAESSDVRGCMIIKPQGYALWENMQQALDKAFKATGHVNAYFPLLIPMSYLEKEAEHIEGFAKECAVVTHTKLEANGEGKLVPASPLEEPYIIRPTSETIINKSFSRWVQSHRDLPIKINQWCNVMRWEMRTRLFLRTSEFLWQEGHTAHATAEEAVAETMQMLQVYVDFAQEVAAIPVIPGEKTPEERFPGAERTYTIESMMQDKKALQSGTSHFLGQHFSIPFDIKFTDKEGKLQYAWSTSWGMTTRMIGALIMTHSDDDGLVCPPRLAPHQIVIIPVIRNSDEHSDIMLYCETLAKKLRALRYHDEPLRVLVDAREINGGEKTWDHIKKGAPIRLEIGPRDMANHCVFMARRDLGPKEKVSLKQEEFVSSVCSLLDEIQTGLFNRASERLKANTFSVSSLDEFMKAFAGENSPGFVKVFCDESADYVELIKPLKASARCIPLDNDGKMGTCIFTGKGTARLVIFAKSY
jgi:prolyl-tRNA synthetase